MDHPSRSPYPGYDVLDKWSSPDWDEQTREVVSKRLFNVPELRFFTDFEMRTLEAVIARIVPQPERGAADRIPILPWIDSKLYEDRRDGYRYDGMPPQREAWRCGVAGIEATANALFDGKGFVDLDQSGQDEVLRRIEQGDAPGATWTTLPARRFFTSMLCVTIVKTYYAHPSAWSEVGYNGPSSPRGHMRIWEGGVDPWEAHEVPVTQGVAVRARARETASAAPEKSGAGNR
ncbi:MAG: gluconate 2-dehydrogenase subunit 3 family protein [Steroidobacteraceae bacterium]